MAYPPQSLLVSSIRLMLGRLMSESLHQFLYFMRNVCVFNNSVAARYPCWIIPEQANPLRRLHRQNAQGQIKGCLRGFTHEGCAHSRIAKGNYACASHIKACLNGILFVIHYGKNRNFRTLDGGQQALPDSFKVILRGCQYTLQTIIRGVHNYSCLWVTGLFFLRKWRQHCPSEQGVQRAGW